MSIINLDEIPFTTDLLLFEVVARSEDGIVHTGNGGEDWSSASLHGSLEIFVDNTSGTEHVTVGKVLGGDISDGKFRENHLGTAQMEFLQFVVEDGPFSINYFLIFLCLFYNEIINWK